MENIAENIAKIKAEINQIRRGAELIAVSKKQPVERLIAALDAGHRVFGENRVQEAAGKFPELRNEYDDIELHLIGPLQTNKVKDALELFDVIQTVDREKLARKLATEIEGARTKEFMIQVNIGEEEQKAGIPPQEAAEFFGFCKNDLDLNVTGLMCIPPADEDPTMYFGLLRNIAEKLDGNLKLSMGMSADYQIAVDLGADYVRIGTGVFGAREY